MAIHTSGVSKYTGRDVNLGGPIQWATYGQQAADNVSILAGETQVLEDGAVTYTDEAGDFAAQPLHARPFRVNASVLSAGASLFVTLYYKDFWGNAAQPESHLFVTADVGVPWDTQGSGKTLVAATFKVLGPPAASATFSIGRGHGIGSPVRFRDATVDDADGNPVQENDDIIALRLANDSTKFDFITLYANPYNTIIYTANEAAPEDVIVEMQSHFDQIGLGT